MDKSPNFQYVEEPSKDVLCSVCLKPWYDPVETPCEHIFCAHCINAALTRTPTCPVCREPIKSPNTDLRRATRILRQQVDRLVVKCLQSDVGCPWVGPRGDIEQHACSFAPPKPAPAAGPLKLTTANEYDAYAFGSKAKALTMLHLEAPILPPEFMERVRKPIHICAVLDVSGSMGGEKMTLLKDTMRFVVREMQSTDSLSIVKYNNSASVTLTDTFMTPDGKQQALVVIESLSAGGGTNISDGFFLGLKQFGFDVAVNSSSGPSSVPKMQTKRPSVTSKPPSMMTALYKSVTEVLQKSVSVPTPPPTTTPTTSTPWTKPLDDDTRSVWLLTDGETNAGIQDPLHFSQAIKSTMGARKDVTVYSFGFGTPHNEELLSTISEAGGGQYYFIKEFASITKSFADCLGGLMSIVVKNVEITATAPRGVRILRLLGETAVPITGNKMTTSIRDMCSEEQKDIIVEVELDPLSTATTAPQHIITWDVSYISSLDSTSFNVVYTSSVTRPATVDSALPANAVVAEQRVRVEVLEAMDNASALCNLGQYDQAQAMLNSVRSRAEKVDSKQCQMLTKKCEQAVSSASAGAWEREGKYKVKSMCMEQRYQRSCEDDGEAMYSNAMKCSMKSRAK